MTDKNGRIAFSAATRDDFGSWMELLELVQERFPGLDRAEYTHSLHDSMRFREAFCAKVGSKVVGAVTFSKNRQELTFLAVHPQFRRNKIACRLVQCVLAELPPGGMLSVVTYRETDPNGIEARCFYRAMGFKPGELLTCFGYPCQHLICQIPDQHS